MKAAGSSKNDRLSEISIHESSDTNGTSKEKRSTFNIEREKSDISCQLINDGQANIDILDDDCLIVIFSLLSPFQRTDVEIVCKRWQAVIRYMWSTLKALSIDELILSHPNNKFVNTRNVQLLLKKCGSSLRELKISMYGHHLNSEMHQQICQLCPNLEVIILSALPPDAAAVTLLADHCKRLKRVNFDNAYDVHDSILMQFFKQNVSLEDISLFGNTAISGKCLKALGPAMKSLCLDYCIRLKNKHLMNGFEQMTQLKKLSLNSCALDLSDLIVGISRNIPTLSYLSLTDYRVINTSSLHGIVNLKDLSYLNLALNMNVTDDILNKICTECSLLKTLDISGCDANGSLNNRLTISGLSFLSKLPNLVNLSTNDMDIIDDNSIACLAARGILQRLSVCGCKNFGDDSVLQVLQACTDLRFLDISRCGRVTNGSLHHIYETIAKQQNRRYILQVRVIYTNIDVGQWKKMYWPHPLIRIKDTDSAIFYNENNEDYPESEDDYFFTSDGRRYPDDFNDCSCASKRVSCKRVACDIVSAIYKCAFFICAAILFFFTYIYNRNSSH